jgi:hypothetical protein
VLELLVILEEAPKLVQRVLGQLRDVLEVRHRGIVRMHGDDLGVLLVAVDHVHDADRARLHDAQGDHGILSENEDVHGIAVVPVGAGNEAVVGRVVDRAVEDPVEVEESRRLVQLVLGVAALRDLDDASQLLGEPVAELYVVPGVGHKGIIVASSES